MNNEQELDIHMGLLMRYKKPVIPLDIAVKEWLPHLSRDVAQRRANKQSLPFPVFRADSSNKADYMVYITDIAAWLRHAREEALNDWNKVHS